MVEHDAARRGDVQRIHAWRHGDADRIDAIEHGLGQAGTLGAEDRRNALSAPDIAERLVAGGRQRQSLEPVRE